MGFKLVGVETREVATRREAMEALKVAFSTPDVGIIIITERAASMVRDEIDKRIYQQQMPLILEVPSRGEQKKRRNISEFVKKAIGISV